MLAPALGVTQMRREERAAVAVFRDPKLEYPNSPPFNPPRKYPEYPFKGLEFLDEGNGVYDAVRETLRLLGLDIARFGTAEWNPLGQIVRPGDNVVIKPNLVLDYHINDETLFSIVTHGSVIRAITDYVLIALSGRGSILFADAPQFNADFERIIEANGLADLFVFYQKYAPVPVRLMDLRRVRCKIRNGIVVQRRVVEGPQTESVIVDLGGDSMFSEDERLSARVFGSDYDRRQTLRHHRSGRHEYCISKRILECDVLIGVPKLKTHKKTGVTLNLKNLVGINTDKNFLPHYRVGDAREGGDEYPVENRRLLRAKTALVRRGIDSILARGGGPVSRLAAALMPILFPVDRQGPFRSEQPQIDVFYERFLQKPVRMGNWEGNDTAWRMVLDIARAFFYADREGAIRNTPQRRFFSLVDGVIAGEGNGPMAPKSRAAGLLAAGADPVAVDWVCTEAMGFDPNMIKLLTNAVRPHRLEIGRKGPVEIRTNWQAWQEGIQPGESLSFEPPDHWDSIKA